jgi:hypothetical protein
MKKILRFFPIFLFFMIPVNADAQHLAGKWFINSGSFSNGGLEEEHIVQYPDGSVCQLGVFTGEEFTIYPFSLTLDGEKNMFVARIAPDGNVLWAQQIISKKYYCNPVNFRTDIEGNLHLIGQFNDTIVVIGDDTLRDVSGQQNSKLFYTVLDPAGNPTVLKNLFPWDNTANINPVQAQWDEQGNLLVYGSFNGDSLYAGDILLRGKPWIENFFLFYFNASGEPLWGNVVDVDTDGGQEPWFQMNASGTVLHPDGSVTVGVSFEGNCPPIFGDDTLSSGTEGSAIVVMHYDAAGAFQWYTSSYAGSYDNMLNISSLQPTSDGGVYITGEYGPQPMTLGDVTLDYGEYVNYFIYRFTADGAVRWAQTIPVKRSGYGDKKSAEIMIYKYINEMIVDKEDNIYLTGVFFGDTLDLPGDDNDVIRKSRHYSNQFVAKFDPDGGTVWSLGITNEMSNIPLMILSNSGRIYLCSSTNDSIILPADTIDYRDGESMAYLLGIDQDGQVVYTNKIVCLDNGSLQPEYLQENIRNNLFVMGQYNQELLVDNISVMANYSSNLFLLNLSPDTHMQGSVSTVTGLPVTAGNVSLIYLNKNTGEVPVTDLVTLTDQGTFTFDNFLYGNYLVYAMPDPTAFPLGVGTYYTGTALWFEADTLRVNNSDVRGVDISLILLTTDLTGTGTLTGNLSYSTSKKSTASILGEPVKKVKVILIGVEKSENIIAWVYTDDQGNYRFENIPDGDYRIMVDIPGLPMDSTYTVSVKGDVISGLDFLVTSTEIQVTSPSGISHPAVPVAEMKVWPSPTTGVVSLQTDEMTGGTLTLFNIKGASVKTFTIDKTLMTLDLSDLPDGVYYLRAVNNKQVGLAKLIIQH